jgi:hypothetical protein
MTWINNASATPTADGDGNQNRTVRQVISYSVIANAKQSYCRITFKAGVSQGLKISEAYIGQAADSGDAYDFQTTPVQILFNGLASCTIEAGGSIVSDKMRFTIPEGKNIVISFYIPNDVNYDTTRYGAQSGWSSYSISNNSAATVNVTGYDAGSNVVSVLSVDSFYFDGVSSVAISDFGFM